MAISKLSRPYPSAVRVTEQMCESSLNLNPVNSPLKLPRQACVQACATTTLPLPGRLLLRKGDGVCVRGGGAFIFGEISTVYWRSMHDLQGLARQDTDNESDRVSVRDVL